MITVEQFQERCKALYKSQQTMAAAKYWKSGRRKGMVRRPAVMLEFDRDDLTRWLWKRVGLNATQCLYCGKAIDILSLTLDHCVPRFAGGRMSLENMQMVCRECNEQKGEMTGRAFGELLRFLRETLSPYDQGILLKRLKAAHHGSPHRFFRPKPQDRPRIAASQGDVFELPEF